MVVMVAVLYTILLLPLALQAVLEDVLLDVNLLQPLQTTALFMAGAAAVAAVVHLIINKQF